MYTTRHEGVFPEEDFQLIAELGFDFVRLPMSYRTWTVGGAYWYTPNKVMLDWMSDVMDVLQGYNIGYALWNFRGQFGILDSMRKDCKYEEWHGHLLDRQMLENLKAH